MKIEILLTVVCSITVSAVLQCDQDSMNQCWCTREDGSKLDLQPDENLEACDCILTRDAAHKHKLIGSSTPQCQKNGYYKKKQCSGSTGACWCVDEKTGAKTSQNPESC